MREPSHIEYLQAHQRRSFSSCSPLYFCTNGSSTFYFHRHCGLFLPDLFPFKGTLDHSSCLISSSPTEWAQPRITQPIQGSSKKTTGSCSNIFLLLAKARPLSMELTAGFLPVSMDRSQAPIFPAEGAERSKQELDISSMHSTAGQSTFCFCWEAAH